MAVDDQYTKSLLHFDGNLTDETGKTWTANGGAMVSTAQSKFGGSALDLSNGLSSLSTINDYGFTQFTIEAWFYRPSAITRSEHMFYFGPNTNGSPYLFLAIDGKVGVHLHNVASNVIVASTTHPTQQWVHYALEYDGAKLILFMDGILQGSYTCSPVMNSTIFYLSSPYSGNYWTGYIDELRISKGIARWTSNFTPPTAPYGGYNYYQAMTGGM